MNNIYLRVYLFVVFFFFAFYFLCGQGNVNGIILHNIFPSYTVAYSHTSRTTQVVAYVPPGPGRL